MTVGYEGGGVTDGNMFYFHACICPERYYVAKDNGLIYDYVAPYQSHLPPPLGGFSKNCREFGMFISVCVYYLSQELLSNKGLNNNQTISFEI